MKRKIVLALISVSMLLCSCGNVSGSSAVGELTESTVVVTDISISEYTDLVTSFNTDVSANMLSVYNMGKYEYSVWNSLIELGGSPDYNDLTTKAFSWLEEKSDSSKEIVTTMHDSIQSQYADIIVSNISDSKTDEIEAIVKTIYDNYVTFYNCVITPSGSIDDFAITFNTCSQSLQKDTETLSILLK